MSKRTQSPSVRERCAALIRHLLNVPSRTELLESLGRMREDQIHGHRLWALTALEREARRASNWDALGRAADDLDQALDAFGQMEPPK